MNALEEQRPHAGRPRTSRRPPGPRSSTWASSGAARSTWPPTSRPGAIADLPVELEGALGRSVRDAESVLARGSEALRERAGGAGVRCRWTRASTPSWSARSPPGSGGRPRSQQTGENVFSMLRRIGQAKAVLAADYTAQLAHSVGKVVFFAKHVDVMDAAEQTFARAGCAALDPRATRRPGCGRARSTRSSTTPTSRWRCARSPPRGSDSTCRWRRTWCSPSCPGRRRADAGDRPDAPDRPGPPVTAWRIIASADDGRPDRRAHRRQGRPRGARARRVGRGALGGRPPEVQLGR